MKSFVCSYIFLAVASDAFFVPSWHTSRTHWKLSFSTKESHVRSKGITSKRTNASDEMLKEMRADIERMKKEAAERLDALNEKLIVVSQERDAMNKNVMPNQDFLETITSPQDLSATSSAESSLTEIANVFERDMSSLSSEHANECAHDVDGLAEGAASIGAPSTIRHPLKLLDDTRWRLMLTVGRVPGTWMPKTWGASGDRLRLQMEVELTPEALYEREDFFNGQSDGAKVLKVCGGKAYLAPNMKEGGRSIRVRDGGWRVCPNEGPLGTSILRFYVNVEEEARHLGSDVYLPRGRVYGTCGYFPQHRLLDSTGTSSSSQSLREVYRQELKETELKYNALQNEMDNDPDLISIQKFQRFQELRDLRQQAHKCIDAMKEVDIKEPKKSNLRLSRDQSVGLTQEGGLCLRKQNGISEEYHVLGNFEVASIENREHSDYKDILSP